MKPDAFESALDDLDVRLERLFSLYEQFLAGAPKIDPIALQKDIGRRIVRMQAEPSPSDAATLRLRGILDRFENLQRYWERLSGRMKSGAHQRVPAGEDPRALTRSASSGGWELNELDGPILELTLRGHAAERPPVARKPTRVPTPRDRSSSARTPPLGTPAVHGPWAETPNPAPPPNKRREPAKQPLEPPPSLRAESPNARQELDSLPEILPTSIRPPPPLLPTSPLPRAPGLPAERDAAKTARDLKPFRDTDSAKTLPDLYAQSHGDSAVTLKDLRAQHLDEPPSTAETKRMDDRDAPTSSAETQRIEEHGSRLETPGVDAGIADALKQHDDDDDDRAPTLRVEPPPGKAALRAPVKPAAGETSGVVFVAGHSYAVDPRNEEPTPVGPRLAELQARGRKDPHGSQRPPSELVPIERAREIQAELNAKNNRRKPVSLERLTKMLEETAAKLKAQHGDRSITFEVVMKDGKAVIKPIVR